MPKRGDRVAPAPRGNICELRFAGDSANGWERLVQNVRTAALTCYDALSSDPFHYSNRQKQLKGDLATREVNGRLLPQWQFEVTSGGRVWYCPEETRRLVWLTEVELTAPKQTHR